MELIEKWGLVRYNEGVKYHQAFLFNTDDNPYHFVIKTKETMTNPVDLLGGGYSQ